MERIIAKALLEQLVENDLLSSAQHGFLKGKSTCTNLLDSHMIGHCLYRISMESLLLIQTLANLWTVCRIRNYSFAWLSMVHVEIYSHGWKTFSQRDHTSLEQMRHCLTRVHYSGVEQRNVIGPVAFLIYVDDLAEVLLQYVMVYEPDA